MLVPAPLAVGGGGFPLVITFTILVVTGDALVSVEFWKDEITKIQLLAYLHVDCTVKKWTCMTH